MSLQCADVLIILSILGGSRKNYKRMYRQNWFKSIIHLCCIHI